MVTKFVSCCMGQAHRLSFFVGCSATFLIALQTLAFGASVATTESLTGETQSEVRAISRRQAALP